MPKIICPSCSTSYELPDGSIDPDGRKVKCATCGTKWHAVPMTIRMPDPVLDSVSTDFVDEHAMDGWTEAEAAGTHARRPPRSASQDEDKAAPIDAEFEDVDDDDVAVEMPAIAQDSGRLRPVNPLMRASVERNKPGKVNRYEIKEMARERQMRILRPLAFAATIALVAGLVVVRESVVRLIPDLAKLYEFAGFDVNLRGFEIRNVRSERVVETTGPVLIITGEIENVKDTIAQSPKLRFALKTNTNEEIYGWEHELSVPTIVPGGITHFQTRLPSPPPLGRNISVRFARN
ncbi:MAG: zinc-ribbon domain-containing protein [Rhizobiales bacterium]|nr:zinc-ribbon domain-containing protein [Hyphomicrobiales bacterium]